MHSSRIWEKIRFVIEYPYYVIKRKRLYIAREEKIVRIKKIEREIK
jgi:hypothetical protein